MITLLGSLLGFLGAAFPEFLKLFRDRADRRHELEILDRQIDLQKQGFAQRLEEIRVSADVAESRAIYKTYYTGIRWVDALNGTERPVLAYAFFVLYAGVKCAQMFTFLSGEALPWLTLANVLWTEDDAAIFAGIISFYFGSRAMRRVRILES